MLGVLPTLICPSLKLFLSLVIALTADPDAQQHAIIATLQILWWLAIFPFFFNTHELPQPGGAALGHGSDSD